MQTSAGDDGVFVRSLASRGQFGGLSAEVWPMSLVMLAGFDIVLIETVGVGQREVDISRICDTTCYCSSTRLRRQCAIPEGGHIGSAAYSCRQQGGYGCRRRRTLAELGAALHREHPDGHWQVPVLATSATTCTGIEALADSIEQHHNELRSRNQLASRRLSYQAYWIHKRLQEEFGSFGVDQLGGEKALLAQLQVQDSNLLEYYEALRQRLHQRFVGSKQ